MDQPAPVCWQPIGETVAEFRSECSDFEHLVQSLFDQLDLMRGELDRKLRDLERERHKVAERERQLSEQRKETSRIAHQFEHQEAKLSESLAELDEVKNLIRRQGEETAQRESSLEGQLQKQLEILQRERQTMQRQLTDAQTELAKQAGVACDLAHARKEIADLRAERGARGEGDAVYATGDDSERAAIETELELVRSRAAELYDTLAQERRAIAEQRAESTNEIKQLRRIVEKQAELLSEPASAPVKESSVREVAPVERNEEQADAAPSSDPVIGSVMAQFAKLQKEVAERRKQRKK
jgi:hypothetical protein